MNPQKFINYLNTTSVALEKLDETATALKRGQVSAALFSLKKIEVLNLKNNELGYIPKEIKQLKRLIKLDLADNKITKISEDIGALKNLQYLYLS